MTPELLEKYQLPVYILAIGCGLGLGVLWPAVELLQVLLWPLLALLLYAVFTRVSLSHLRQALAEPRFLVAAITGNFLVLPLLVWGLVMMLPDHPGLRLGVLLVLLVPCTDWFISFTHMGGGETRHAIVFSPLSLLLQMLLLPLYLWLILGQDLAVAMVHREMLLAFGGLILLPLLAAQITRARAPAVLRERMTWAPVPLLALVVFLVAATQVDQVHEATHLFTPLLLAYGSFLLFALVIARLLAMVFRLPPRRGRVLAFSLGTRNSFVVLPLALALPAGLELAVVAIVFQSLVELFGMVLYLWWVPRVFTEEDGT